MKTFQKMDSYVGQAKNYQQPSDDVNPSLKEQKEYYLSYSQYMLAMHVNNMCELPYAFGKDQRTFKEIHQYATGTQSTDKLKDRLLGRHKRTSDGKYITKMNISWDPLRILPKMFDIMREKNMRQDYDVDATCIDDDSQDARAADKAMMKYLVDSDNQAFMRMTKFRPDTSVDPQELGLETKADIDLYFETGGYVLQREMASIAACNKTKLISNYKVIQDGTFDDDIKFGIMGWKFQIDKASNEVIQKRVPIYDPEIGYCPVILPYSESNNFENLSKVAWIKTMTIADLRKECPQLTQAELIYIAKCYSYMNPEYVSLMGNGGFYNTGLRADMMGNYLLDPINRCKILVLDAQWLSTDTNNYLKNEGRDLYKAVDFDYKVSNDRKRKGDTQIQKKVVKKHTCQWVIGTDIFLNYGIAEDNIYYGPNGNKCPSLDYVFSKTGNMSLVERCIGIVDDIDIANIKLRNALSSAVPAPRMIIQTGLLDNVFLNNIKQQPEDNMATFKELGYLMVNAVDDNGKPIFTNQKLVDFLPMGIQEDINVFTGQILAGINNLREVLGIPQGADASTPQKYDSAKSTELSSQTSNAALFPTFNSFQYLFEAGFCLCVKMWQIIAKDRDLKVSYSPLGSKNMKILALDPQFSNADINIKISIGSTDQELQQLMADITQLKQMGITTNFQSGITMSEFLYLREKILSGNTKEAMYVMAKIEKKKMAAQQAINEQNQQQNASDQQNSAAQAELNKQETARVSEEEKRKTIVLQSAEQRKNIAVGAVLKDFDKEGGESAEPLYREIMALAQVEVDSVLGMDSQRQSQGQQPTQPGQPPQMPAPDAPQQQVA